MGSYWDSSEAVMTPKGSNYGNKSTNNGILFKHLIQKCKDLQKGMEGLTSNLKKVSASMEGGNTMRFCAKIMDLTSPESSAKEDAGTIPLGDLYEQYIASWHYSEQNDHAGTREVVNGDDNGFEADDKSETKGLGDTTYEDHSYDEGK